jgi:osmotically-inducible protein OsmY
MNIGEDRKMTDKQIQQGVFAALAPRFGSTEIGIAVQDGVVTLCGYVASQRQSHFAEETARQVYGVKAVVNALISPPSAMTRLSDVEIALETVWALEAHNIVVPTKRLQMTVRDGWIILEGEVDRSDQRDVAEAVVLCQPGVRGITNLIAVRPQVSAVEVRHEIEETLLLNAERDAQRISVDTEDSKVILKGGVRAWTEREDAERAAWRAPGVTEVENRILVVPG